MTYIRGDMSDAILGVDIGGTFTDFTLVDQGEVRVFKTSSTPDDPTRAVLAGIRELEASLVTDISHGSTVATNALLEYKGARTALLVTEGFEDMLEIGRQNRPALYDFQVERPPQLVSPDLRIGVRERLDSDGRAVIVLSAGEAQRIAEQVKESGAGAVAISLLFSFRNPEHERLLVEALVASGVDAFISVSSDLLPEYREYERTSTVVVNAYVGPPMARYLQRLEEAVGRRLRIMHSGGGSLSPKKASQEPVRTLLSGPAAGVVGAFHVASRAGFPQLITLDMGGTSTDVSLCPGRVQETTSAQIGGYPTRMPTIDIHTVGAGGGSIARVDPGGALLVGPESAGADPGPACYGRGERVTVTDANLVLGRLDTGSFLDGRMSLDAERSRFCVERLASDLGQDVVTTAEGVLRVANATMERALRTISLERGFDPRHFTLLAFGGAGPMHACALADGLGMSSVLVPPHPGVLSALGAALADVVKDYSRTLLLRESEMDAEALRDSFRPMEQQARADLERDGFRGSQLKLQRFLDLRYVGQSYELTVPCPPLGARAAQSAARRFHRAHRQRYGHSEPSQTTEVVAVRLKAIGPVEKPAIDPEPLASADAGAAFIEERDVVFGGRPQATGCYDRSLLRPGSTFPGPALVLQMDSTTVIPPGWTARVDGFCNLILESSHA